MATVAWLPDAQNEVFAEDEVTLSALALVIEQAFYKVSRVKDKDGRFTAHIDGLPVIVLLDQDVKLIRFVSMIYGVKESAPLELKLACINKMNNDANLVRFSISESHTPMC